MRKVRMLIGVSGERHDGRRWPPAGGEIDVPDWEADDLILGQNAMEAGAAAEPEPEPEPDPGPEPVAEIPPGTLAEPWPEQGTGVAAEAGLTAEPVVVAADPPAEPEAVQPAVAPPPSAPKQAWIDYAVQAHAADPAEAGAMTKADLMSRYGGRL